MSQLNRKDIEIDSFEKVIIFMRDKALAGCMESAAFIVNLIPDESGESYVDMDILSSVKTIEDVNIAMTEVITQVGNSNLSLEDAFKIMELLSIKRNTLLGVKSKEKNDFFRLITEFNEDDCGK